MKKKKITLAHILLFLAASYAAYNFGLAGGIIEKSKFSIGGFILGVIVNISIAIAAGSYGSLKGNKRTGQARFAFIALIIVSVFILSPAIYYLLPSTFLSANWMRGIYALAWALAGDLAIILAGAVAGRPLIALDAPAPQAQASAPALSTGASSKPAGAKKRTAPDLRTQCVGIAQEYACKIPECGWSPSVENLIAVAQKGRSPKASANSAHSAHFRHAHYSKVEEKVKA